MASQPMTKPTTLLSRLDEAHSTIVDAANDFQLESAVLRTLASALGSVPALDKQHNDPDYWRQVSVNLNTLADRIEHDELSEISLGGEEYDLRLDPNYDGDDDDR